MGKQEGRECGCQDIITLVEKVFFTFYISALSLIVQGVSEVTLQLHFSNDDNSETVLNRFTVLNCISLSSSFELSIIKFPGSLEEEVWKSNRRFKHCVIKICRSSKRSSIEKYIIKV